jgi:hypothetical protein
MAMIMPFDWQAGSVQQVFLRLPVNPVFTACWLLIHRAAAAFHAIAPVARTCRGRFLGRFRADGEG